MRRKQETSYTVSVSACVVGNWREEQRKEVKLMGVQNNWINHLTQTWSKSQTVPLLGTHLAVMFTLFLTLLGVNGVVIVAMIDLFIQDQFGSILSTLVLLMDYWAAWKHLSVQTLWQGQNKNTAYANRIILCSQLKGSQAAVNPL